jgi:serine-type D-Ala-D-Ala carboxypeptidase/endopeptidase (penicillin-binding protein 4)
LFNYLTAVFFLKPAANKKCLFNFKACDLRMYVKNYWIVASIGLLVAACTQPPVVEQPRKTTKAPVSQVQAQQKPEEEKPVLKRAALPAKLTDLPPEIMATLEKVKLSPDGLSVFIQSLESDAPLLAFNEDVPRNPASVMKVVTTYASLGTLGADYRWPVELYTNGTVNGDTLQGDLFLKGYGSPNFKEPELHHLLDDLRASGIKHITGNLVIDNSHFSIVKHDTGEFDGKRYAAYNAQSDALLYNEGISEFIVNGHGVYSPNPARNVQIADGLQFKNVPCSARYAYPKTGIRNAEDSVTVQFSGVVSSRCGERKYSFVLTDPANMLHSTVTHIWTRDMAGTLAGQDFIVASTPANAQLLAKVDSEPVSDILPMINKKSNNVMAQQLFLSIGAKQPGDGDTSEKAYQGIQQWFRSRGLDFPELVMENGSGLSRNGQVSARHIAELLRDAYHHPQRDVFINSLPILGVDGTLKNRLRGTHLAGHGHLKTGTLNNAKALAGYVTADNGETFVVAILHNDPTVKYKARPVHDQLIAWTARQGGNATEPLPALPVEESGSSNSVYFE